MLSTFVRLVGLFRSNILDNTETALVRQRVLAAARKRCGKGLGAMLCAVCLGVAWLFGTSASIAQAPVAIPQTATLLAGGASAAGTGVSGMVLPVSGAACYTGSLLKATDAYGDGCPGPYAVFSTDFRGGVLADGAGNVYVIDGTEKLLRKIDAKSGVVTAVTGTAITGCTTNSDAYGDGCPMAQTLLGSARGGSIDPYGNVIIAGYNMSTVNIICNAVSPLCPNTANHKQVGYMYRIAGCVASAAATGSASVGATAGTAGDGLVASPFGNLSGDVSDWGSGSTTYGTCSSSLGGVDQARGATADKYGNVYIADTANLRYRVVVGPATFTLPNGTVLTNPLASIIALNPTYSTITAASAYGHIYPILGYFSTSNGGVTPPTAAGTACAGPSGGTTLDTVGDGCPFYESTGGASTSSTLGVGIDSEGNPIFLDQNNKVVRVLYISGSKMAAAIQKANNNSSLTITPGYIYPLIGLGGATGSGISFIPQLGTATAINSQGSRMAVDPSGNLYFGDATKYSVYMFDLQTGYARNVLVTGTACATAAPNNDSVGDGCSSVVFGSTTPSTSPFAYSSSGYAMSIAFDPQGNLILGDIEGTPNSLIRKILATDLAPVRVGTTQTQQITIHAPAGSTGVTAALVGTSPDISVGTVTCAAAANADTTLDCQIPVTFTPLTPGQRTGFLTVTATGAGTSATFPITGNAIGTALVADASSPVVSAFGVVGSAQSLAADGAGNLFTLDTGASSFVQFNAAGTKTTLGGTLPSSPYQLAVDFEDNLYATNGTALITKDTLSAAGTYTSSAITPLLPLATYASTPATLTATPTIYGVAVDTQGNIFFSDRANEAVFEIPAGGYFENLNQVLPVVTGFTSVGELALDGAGNLLIADVGAGTVYRLLANTPLYPTLTITAALASTPVNATTVASSVVPTHIAVDVAGNAYIQDATAKTVTEIPLSGATATVYTTVYAPQGIAVARSGVLYEAEATLTSINAIARNAFSYTFPNTTTTLPVTLSNVGNLAATGYAQTDNTEFPLTTGASNGCGTIPSTANPLLIGYSCTLTAGFNPGNNGNLVTSATTLLPATYSVGALTLKGQEPQGITYTTTTSVTTPILANRTAVYQSTATELTFTIAESSSNSNSQNGESINVVIDSGSAVAYTLSGGSITVPVSGLTVGSHTLTATYPGDGTYLTSTTGAISFSITQASTSVSWTPGTTTQQYSAAIGTGVLNATANAAGSFIYTATPSGGTAQYIHSASYLAVGTYSLGVTFVPTDSVDFASSTATVATYTVTKATTTAAVGATQFLVASDSTGNYTSVQDAVNALPSGGSIYIKPGTYTGNVAVVQPNISLRGLGGDPTKVILTHAGGAFGSSYPYTGEFTVAMENGYQLPTGSTQFNGDEGSATLVVAKGINTALSTTSQTPNGFYAEYLTIANTYDTDTTTTTTTYETSSNGTCTTNAGSAMTYSALYNAGTLCGSQALAVWTTSDLSIMNHTYLTSLQDTLYAASQGSGSNGYVPARQYWFRGKITGDVDYLFGDAAAVFDNTSIYTMWHGSSATGTETIHAQNKAVQTGSSNDYLSGYVMNSDVFTSQSTGMTNLYFGRPYGTYSTWIMLNSYVDQVNALGYTTGLGPTLAPTTFGEFNDQAYTDPATNAADLNGVVYLGSGGNTGSGVIVNGTTVVREAASTNPGTAMTSNGVPTTMTQAQAQAYFPTNFLSQTVSSLVSSTQNWNPTAAIASAVNAFVPTGSSATVAGGSSVTILMRPQTPGIGAVSNGVYTIPTGTYTLTDTISGATTTTLVSGKQLDASGEAYLTTSNLAIGTHSLYFSYGGDSNFASSTTTAPFVLTVTAGSVAQTITFTAPTTPVSYGVSPITLVATGGASGNAVVFSVVSGPGTISGSVLTVTGVGTIQIAANQAGNATYAAAATVTQSIVVNPATQTIAFTAPTTPVSYGVSPITLVATGGASGNAVTFSVTGPGTISGSVLTVTGVGTIQITANQAGNTNYAAATAVTQSVVVTQAAQTINFTAPTTPVNYGVSSITLVATGGASGNAVVFSVVSGPGTISGSVLTVTGVGTIQIAANQAGNANYAAATAVTQSIVVNAISQSITFTAPTTPVTYGVSPITLVATGGASGNAVTFTVTGPGTISGSVLTVTGVGTIQITANQAGNANYAAATAVTQSIVVNAIGTAATPSFTPGTGTYTAAQNVSISDTTAGAVIYYTTNGSTPTTSSSVYSGTITVAASETLKAIAVATGYTTSGVASASYTFVNPAPVLSSLSPAIATAGDAAFVLTINGTGLTASSVVYWGSSTITSQYVSANQLTIQVPAALVADAGTSTIYVVNPAPGGGISNSLQFEVNSLGSAATAPTYTSVTATVTGGSAATYAVSLPSSVASATVACLNLPTGATCSYSGGVVTIATSATTPAGSYPITIVFTETLPGVATSGLLLPILLLPLFFLRKRLATRGLWLTAFLGLLLMTAAAATIGCGGGNNANSSPTHTVISSAVVTLTVK